MAATYDPTGLATSQLFRARLALGDRGTILDKDGSQVWLLTDEEIVALITLHGYREGVAQLAEALATEKAQEPDEYTDEGGVEVRWSERVKAWLDLAKRMRTTVQEGSPLAAGVPISGRSTGPDMKGVRP